MSRRELRPFTSARRVGGPVGPGETRTPTAPVDPQTRRVGSAPRYPKALDFHFRTPSPLWVWLGAVRPLSSTPVTFCSSHLMMIATGLRVGGSALSPKWRWE